MDIFVKDDHDTRQRVINHLEAYADQFDEQGDEGTANALANIARQIAKENIN